MGDTDEYRRRSSDRFLNADRMLQTMGGVLLAIVAALTWRSFEKIDAHEGRIIRVEERTEESKKEQAEIKGWLQKLSDKVDRIGEAVGAKKP